MYVMLREYIVSDFFYESLYAILKENEKGAVTCACRVP